MVIVKEKGQIVLVLILVMTIALAIGLSIVQKSLVDISTASKVEQSSRAFSAAEAGVEKALKGDRSLQSFADTGSKIIEINDNGLNPPIATSGNRQAALEYPPLAKEDIAQIWLADFSSPNNPPNAFYTQNSLDVYWGDFSSLSSDKAALELTLVYYNGSYVSKSWYLDHFSASRNNGFEKITCNGATPQGGSITYQCQKTINFTPEQAAGLKLIRARLLYNSTSQPLAFQAVGNCGNNCSLPPQARSIISTGVAGENQRRVKVFQETKVVPPYFNYAIFSAGDISK